MKHFIYSEDQNKVVFETEDYQPELLLNAIIKHLQTNVRDTVEHRKEHTLTEKKKFYGGFTIIDFYEINPKNGKPSKCVIKGQKYYYKLLID